MKEELHVFVHAEVRMRLLKTPIKKRKKRKETKLYNATICRTDRASYYMFVPEGEDKFTARLTNTAAGRACLSLKELTSIKTDVWQSVM